MTAKRKGPGRPSKLTPEVQAKLLDALRAGNYRHIAAHFAGIGMRTLREWMAAGERAPDSEHGKFRRAVIEAERGAEIGHVARIAKAAQAGDWKASAWWLERKANERWGRPERRTSGAGAQDEAARMSDADLLARVRELMTAAEGNAPGTGRVQ